MYLERWKKERRRYDAIIVCHGSALLADCSVLNWKRYLEPAGIISVLAVNRAAAGNCYDVQVRDQGESYDFGYYGRGYLEHRYSLPLITERAKGEFLRVTCYDHAGLSLLANNVPFGGEYANKIDAWKAYEVVFFSYNPLPVVARAYTPISECADLFLSRPVPLEEEHLVGLQQIRFLVKEKTDGVPALFVPTNPGEPETSAFHYTDRVWTPASYGVPRQPLRYPLQVEVILEGQVATFFYVDYFAPGDFLERRLLFERDCRDWSDSIVYKYRDPDARFFREFLDPTKHEGFVIQPTNTPFVKGVESCYYVKGRPTVDLSFEDAVKYTKSTGVDWSFPLKSYWPGIVELDLNGTVIRPRNDKKRSNTFAEFQRVRRQVPYMIALFSLVEVAADIGVLRCCDKQCPNCIDANVIEEIRRSYASKRKIDRDLFEKGKLHKTAASPAETE